MRSVARRPSSLTLGLDFSSKTRAADSMGAYAAEISAGIAREGWAQAALAHAANVSASTISQHSRRHVRNPSVRTMFSVLFSLGWSDVTIVKDGIRHNGRKVG